MRPAPSSQFPAPLAPPPNLQPGAFRLHRKDCLAAIMSPLRLSLPHEFDFAPVTFNNNPGDMEALRAFVGARPDREDGTPWTYIVKPAGGLQGAGIYLTLDPVRDAPPESAGKHVIQATGAAPLCVVLLHLLCHPHALIAACVTVVCFFGVR